MSIISKLAKYTLFTHVMEQKPFKWSSLSVWSKAERKITKENEIYTE